MKETKEWDQTEQHEANIMEMIRTASHKFYEAQGMTNHHYKFCIQL